MSKQQEHKFGKAKGMKRYYACKDCSLMPMMSAGVQAKLTRKNFIRSNLL